MTITVSKFKLAISIVVIALLVPAAAIASDAWSDVEDGRFYHDAVAWAKSNGMTTGCNGGSGFCPNDGVTRGENITFAKRYDDLVVQPALADLEAADSELEAADDALQDAIDSLPVVMFATINANGEVYKGSLGLESSVKNSTGNYTLTFDRNVEECAATTADRVFIGTRDVSTDAGFGGSDTVIVRITGENGALVDSYFDIIVAC